MLRKRFGRIPIALAMVATVIGLALAACGGDSNGSSGQPASSPASSSKSGWG